MIFPLCAATAKHIFLPHLSQVYYSRRGLPLSSHTAHAQAHGVQLTSTHGTFDVNTFTAQHILSLHEHILQLGELRPCRRGPGNELGRVSCGDRGTPALIPRQCQSVELQPPSLPGRPPCPPLTWSRRLCVCACYCGV